MTDRWADNSVNDLSAPCKCGHEYRDHYATFGGDTGCSAFYDDGDCGCDGFTVARPVNLYIRIAEVYPDKSVKRSRFTETIDASDAEPIHRSDDLRADHLQGHCGFHVYVSGSNLDLVNQRFREQIARAQELSDGKCPQCKRTGPYKTDWDFDPEEIIGWHKYPKAERGGGFTVPDPGGACDRCGSGTAISVQTKLVGYGRRARYYRGICADCYGEHGRCPGCDTLYVPIGPERQVSENSWNTSYRCTGKNCSGVTIGLRSTITIGS